MVKKINKEATTKIPFGAASKKQQMILESNAQILVIGGGV